ncbi:hypothetical protein BX600DRAFT_548465 [Xylariales sp. PMI_506]|nr:hypothetical protein BX600DRAFT_548465 [Xylariales sp. PMI_506]
MYDDATNGIYYALCNSNSTPVFPADNTAKFELDFEPMKGTNVAGVGYEANGYNVAAMHYQETGGGIVQALYTCDDTGHYVKGAGTQSWIVSTAAGAASILPQTGLSVVDLGSTLGYRIYYKDGGNKTAAISYMSQNWDYEGFVTQFEFTGPSVAAAFVHTDRISVIDVFVPPNGVNANISLVVNTLQDGIWLTNSFPYFLYAWNLSGNGTDTSITNTTGGPEYDWDVKPGLDWQLDTISWNSYLGVTLDDHDYRTIYYIGGDMMLNQVQENGTSWAQVPQQDMARWPMADAVDACFGVTFDVDHRETWIYYISNGNMTQLHQTNGTWDVAVALPKFNATNVSGADANSSGGSGGGVSGGLSKGDKIGIGVGVASGLLVIVGVTVAYLRVRNSRANRDKEHGAVEAAHAEATTVGASIMSQAPETSLRQTMSPPPPSDMSSPVSRYLSGYWGGGVVGAAAASAADGGAVGAAAAGYFVNGQWVPAGAYPRHSLDPRFSGGLGLDWQQSQALCGDKAMSPPVVVQPTFEMAHEELRYEMAGDETQISSPAVPLKGNDDGTHDKK